jgi:hypothetical protein
MPLFVTTASIERKLIQKETVNEGRKELQKFDGIIKSVDKKDNIARLAPILSKTETVSNIKED